MTIETQARDLLLRAADEVDVEPPPVDALLGSAARRRRRMAAVVAGLSAAAVVVTVAIVSTGGHEVGAPVTSSPTPPTTAPGTRLVGMNGVMVSVPQDWATNRVRCGTPMGDTVFWNTGAIRLCRIVPSPEVSALQIIDLGQNGSALSLAQQAHVPVTIGDIQAYRMPTRSFAPSCPMVRPGGKPVQCPYPRYEGTLYFPSLGLVLFASSPDRGVVDPILDSAKLIPDGYVAVPLNATAAELEALGLQVDVRGDIGPDRVAPTDPPVGSVVAVGSTIAIGRDLNGLVPDGAGTRMAGMDGVVVSVPDDWPTDDIACSGSDTSAVVFPHEGGTCLIDPAKAAAVYIVPSQSPLAEPWRSMNSATAGPVDGSLRFATTRWGCATQSGPCGDGFYAGAVTLDGVTVWAAGPSTDTVDAMLESVGRIPDGFVAVPRLPTAQRLADVGLNVDLPQGAAEDDLLETSPTAGRIVPAGSTVDVTYVQKYPLDFGPGVSMTIAHGAMIQCDFPPAGAAGPANPVVTVEVRAAHTGEVTLALTSGGQAIGESGPTWMFSGQRTILFVPIAGSFRDNTARLHIVQRIAGGGEEANNLDVKMPPDQVPCS
jgi:hypothetical protein